MRRESILTEEPDAVTSMIRSVYRPRTFFRSKLTHLIFPFLISDPLEDVMHDPTSGGIAEKSVFVVDDETAVKQASYYAVKSCEN